MKGYYKERYEKTKIALQIAEIGFKSFVGLMNEGLQKCSSEDVLGIANELSLACEVMKDLRDDLEQAEEMIKE